MSGAQDPLSGIQRGMQRTDTYVVEAAHCASEVGSGTIPVLATPWLIAYMERTAHRLVAEALPAEYTSVGVLVNVQHLAPTPVGDAVTVHARVEEVAGRRIFLAVQAHDETDEVGKGHHQRMTVKTAWFLERLAAKRKDQAPG